MQPMPIVLPKGVARCVPMSKPCPQRSNCAQGLCTSTAVPVTDYTLEPYYVAGYCSKRLSPAAHRQAPTGEKPRVHEAPEGLK